MPDTPSRTSDFGYSQQSDDAIWWLDHHVMINPPMIDENIKWKKPKTKKEKEDEAYMIMGQSGG